MKKTQKQSETLRRCGNYRQRIMGEWSTLELSCTQFLLQNDLEVLTLIKILDC